MAENASEFHRWLVHEGVLLPDELAAGLPFLPRDHPHCERWMKTAYAVERLTGRIRLLSYNLSILEIGCGCGWLSHMLARLEKTSVVGIDRVAPYIDMGRRLFGERDNLDFQVADIFTDPVTPGAYDLILVHGAVEYFPDLGRLIGQAREMLNPKGELHFMGSPFFEIARTPAARQRIHDRFDELNLPGMKSRYFLHPIEAMTALGAQMLYNPYRRNGEFKSRVARGKDSEYPWFVFPEGVI